MNFATRRLGVDGLPHTMAPLIANKSTGRISWKSGFKLTNQALKAALNVVGCDAAVPGVEEEWRSPPLTVHIR
jgi:hypothetical protein